MAALVVGQEGLDINLHCEKVSNGVSVLGAVEAPQRLRSAGIRIPGGGLIQGRFQSREQRLAIRDGRPGHACRRHRARAELVDDLFPHAGIQADTPDVGLIEPEASGRFGSAVAGNTVLVQNPSMLRAGTRSLGI